MINMKTAMRYILPTALLTGLVWSCFVWPGKVVPVVAVVLCFLFIITMWFYGLEFLEWLYSSDEKDSK